MLHKQFEFIFPDEILSTNLCFVCHYQEPTFFLFSNLPIRCGNQIGNEFWKYIGEEHQVSPDGTYNAPSFEHSPQVYYTETEKNRFIPRNVLVDLEPGLLEKVRSEGIRFKPDNFVSGQSGAGIIVSFNSNFECFFIVRKQLCQRPLHRWSCAC